MRHDETYLGDGLYARFDGFTLWLRAPRESGDHVVGLEPEVFDAMLRFAMSFALLRTIMQGTVAAATDRKKSV